MGIFNSVKSNMLIERLCGVLTYFLSICFFYNKVKYSNDHKEICRYLNIYLVVLCVMGFLYIPANSTDICRWREYSYYWCKMDFSSFNNEVLKSSSSPVAYLMIYLCQKTGIDGLLPFLCVFIFYSNIFHILKKSQEQFDISSDSMAIVLLFFMASGMFLEVMAGVRCFVAFSIISRCIFDEIIFGKSMIKSIPFYIIASLIHTAAIPLIVIRIICAINEKKKNLFVKFMNISTAVLIIVFGNIYGKTYLDDALNRGTGYANNEIYSYFWEHLIGIVSLIVVGYFVIIYWRVFRKKNQNLDNLATFVIILSLVELYFIRSYNIFHRFLVPCLFIFSPVLGWELDCLFYKNDKHSYSDSTLVFLKLISVMILVVACVRGNLCGYKFFLLK